MRERPEAPSIRFTRRELLRQGGIAALALGGLPALLEACSSSSSPTPAGGSSGSSAADISGTTLDFYSWQGYDIPVKPIKEWLKSNDVTIKPSYINTHDDITAKFTTGGGRGNYNLSTYEAGWGPLYIQLGIPSVLDVSKVPNFQKAYEVFKTGTAGKWFNVNGNQYAFPFTWGVQGINYQSDAIDAPTSYRDLLGPSFKNKFGITDDPVATTVIGAYTLGIYRADSLYTPDQLSQIMSFWTQMKGNARLIVPSYGNMADLLASGEIVAGTPGWAAVNSFAADKGDKLAAVKIKARDSVARKTIWKYVTIKALVVALNPIPVADVAGGFVSDMDGGQDMLDTGAVVAGNEPIQRALFK